MAYQPSSGGGGGGGAIVPDLNLPLPETGGVVPDLNLPLPETGEEDPLSMAQWQWPRESTLAIHIRPATTQQPCDGNLCIPFATHVCSNQVASLLANDQRSRGGGDPGRRRLLHFFLKVEGAQTRPGDFYSLLDYAANCGVEDAVIVVAGPGLPEVSFDFQRASHRLMRLVLFNVGVNAVRSIATLEVICIRSASLSDRDLERVLLSCPRLCCLVLTRCRGLTCVDVTAASKRLATLTVAECPQVEKISVSAALSLRSFSYSGDLLRSVALPPTCFGDLYMCFTKSTLAPPIHYFSYWLYALPNLSNLVVLTICSNALELMSHLHSSGDFQPQVAKLSNLQNLRELQLVMYGMDTDKLSHMYGFLRMCRCSQLRNLFVQLPKARTESFVDAVGEMAEEPPMDDFESLVEVKITNFKWQYNEIELVHFLFRKATSLQKVILVVPEGINPERDQSGSVPDLNLLCLGKLRANVNIQVLDSSLGATIKAVHRTIFLST